MDKAHVLQPGGAMRTLSRPQWNLLLIATLVVGALFIAATRVRPGPAVSAPSPRESVAGAAAPRANHPAPDFTLADLSGAPVRLGDLRGQVVLVNLWATWCGPCRAEMPMIQAAYDQYRAQGFTVLAVNEREDAEAVAAYMAEGRLTFPALLDQDGAVGAAYQAGVMPSSFFIDRAGVVRAVYKGPMARSVIAGTVEQLLAEAP
jgi:cytochrome c biogenesis protein CcmG/thiol:disulfide interchange protein DsbE